MNKHNSQILRTLMALVLAVCASGSLKAQLQLEYFFDSDPGFGLGQRMTASPDADGNFSFNAPTTGLEPGAHLLGFRAYQSGESSHFAPTITQQIYVPQNETPFITRVEYFWDNDPGAGKGTALTITTGNEVNLTNVQIPTTGLAKGSHLLGIRAFGDRGWSPLITQEVYVPAATADGRDIIYVEYFWDTDPGYGKGTPLPFTKDQEISIENAVVPVEGLTVGEHLLYVRAYGNNGWTPTISRTVYVEPDVSTFQVLKAEYFWNEDPGFGKGTPIQLTPGAEVKIENLVVPTDMVQGDAVLYVRYQGTMGWSPTVAYPVMVNALGEYILNIDKETSLADRLFQTVPDALYDFDDRGISDHITMKVDTKNKVYEVDATDETTLGRIDRIARNLDEISEPRDHKIIAFTRNTNARTGNTIKVTTTEAGLPTVVSLFAQTSQNNVALTINDVAYNFTPASQRWQIGCSTTTSVALSTISEAIKATWKAQPHEGTTLSGFETQGEGDLPAMEIVNSGTKTDSVAYLVTLSTVEGQKLCDYTYYIYVYAPMQTQTFTNLTPATGSSVDPVATKLTWNAFNDATGYRVMVTEAAEGGDPKTIVNNKVVTTTEYEITVKTGYTYTWTVTAVGHCDQQVSETMTLKGRLLPDLVVESITLPEAAPPGTELTVTATIKNQGTGATTEGQWTDRLYYTINSTKWADRVQATEVRHEGNVAIDGTYEVTFTMTVPDVDSGTLRVFVEANTDKAAMESNTGNNYTMSSTTATMTPVYVNANDLAVLRQLYNDFGGSAWNGTKWKTESELVASSNWSGVTFDTDGYVKAINLQARGLTGSLSTATPLSLSKLTTLNLSRNALTGDPSKYINQGTTPLLTTVDLGYNQIDELSEALPATLTVTLKYQHRKYGSNATLPGLDNLTAQTLNVSNRMEVEVPRIVGYNHSAQTFGNIQTLKVYKRDNMGQLLGNLKWSTTYEKYYYEGYVGHPIQPQEQDDEVVLVPSGGPLENSAYPAKFHMVEGDANLTGSVDVNDVQRTLNYIINTGGGTFSLWAANTWDDDLINIQDIVCTVNIVLVNQGEQLVAVRRSAGQTPNVFYASGRNICLTAQDEIAAFDLMLEGVNSSQIRLMLNMNDWQMQTLDTEYGVRLVVFSPTGQTLPTGDTQILRMSAAGMPIGAQASNADAVDVTIGVAANPTGISELEQDVDNGYVYDLTGRKVKENTVRKAAGIYIKNGKKVMKSWK
jgi:hypothetical protein